MGVEVLYAGFSSGFFNDAEQPVSSEAAKKRDRQRERTWRLFNDFMCLASSGSSGQPLKWLGTSLTFLFYLRERCKDYFFMRDWRYLI